MGGYLGSDQFQLVKKLDSLGCIIAVLDEANLKEAVEKAKNFDFKLIQKGSAENIIRNALENWFHKNR